MNQNQIHKESDTLAPDEKIVLKSQIKSLISELSEDDCFDVFRILKERGIL